MRAGNQTTLAIARLSIGVVRRCTIYGDTLPFDPAHRAVVGYILKQKAVSVPHPHRPLNPAKTGGKRLQRCIAQDIVRKAWRADLKTIHGSPESARRRNCWQYVELHQHQDRRFRSDRAGQVPPLTINLAVTIRLLIPTPAQRVSHI